MRKNVLICLFMILGLLIFGQAQEVSPQKAAPKVNGVTKPQADPNAPPARTAKAPEGYKSIRPAKHATTNTNAVSPMKKAEK